MFLTDLTEQRLLSIWSVTPVCEESLLIFSASANDYFRSANFNITVEFSDEGDSNRISLTASIKLDYEGDRNPNWNDPTVRAELTCVYDGV